MEEVWRQIGVSDKRTYEVSNLGNVRSISAVKQILDCKGYMTVRICGKNVRVHRLVASAFIPNAESKPMVDHINACRTDNRVDNLRWATALENNNNPNNKEREYHAPKATKMAAVSTKDIQELESNSTLIAILPDYKACVSAKNIVTYTKNMYPRKDGLTYSCSINRDTHTITIRVIDKRN